jgi:hypothetical protein
MREYAKTKHSLIPIIDSPSSGRAVRATSRRPWLGYPARPSVADRSAGSTRFCISSKRTPALSRDRSNRLLDVGANPDKWRFIGPAL